MQFLTKYHATFIPTLDNKVAYVTCINVHPETDDERDNNPLMEQIISDCLFHMAPIDLKKIESLLKMSQQPFILTNQLRYVFLYDEGAFDGLIILDHDHSYLVSNISVERDIVDADDNSFQITCLIKGDAIRDDGIHTKKFVIVGEANYTKEIDPNDHNMVECLANGDMEVMDESYFFNENEDDEICSHTETRIYRNNHKVYEYDYLCLRSFVLIPLCKKL